MLNNPDTFLPLGRLTSIDSASAHSTSPHSSTYLSPRQTPSHWRDKACSKCYCAPLWTLHRRAHTQCAAPPRRPSWWCSYCCPSGLGGSRTASFRNCPCHGNYYLQQNVCWHSWPLPVLPPACRRCSRSPDRLHSRYCPDRYMGCQTPCSCPWWIAVADYILPYSLRLHHQPHFLHKECVLGLSLMFTDICCFFDFTSNSIIISN